MLRSDVDELHYITHTSNLESIRRHGLLSHNRAAGLAHKSVANEEVQGRRTQKRVPPGSRHLHDFVNLYFHCRNGMMYVLMARGHTELAVVRVSPAVLDIPGSVIADGNAASDSTRFVPSPSGLSTLDKGRVFARSWNDPDPFRKAELKRQRCAELLVPDKIDPSYIIGYYVHSEEQIAACTPYAAGCPVEVNRNEFFK